MCDESLDKLLRLRGGKILVEFDHEEVIDAQVANQRDFVLSGGKQMRCVVWAQHFDWVWIKGHDKRRAIRRTGMTRGGGDHGLMTAMHAVENADRKEKRAMQSLQFFDRPDNFHHCPTQI
jgi:hypothetical protein